MNPWALLGEAFHVVPWLALPIFIYRLLIVCLALTAVFASERDRRNAAYRVLTLLLARRARAPHEAASRRGGKM